MNIFALFMVVLTLFHLVGLLAFVGYYSLMELPVELTVYFLCFFSFNMGVQVSRIMVNRDKKKQ